MAEMELLPAIEGSVTDAIAEYADVGLDRCLRVTQSEVETIVQKVSHLLYLPILGLTRPRDLYY